jgi:putative spermidine/putrescine transport system ATP-binding protein
VDDTAAATTPRERRPGAATDADRSATEPDVRLSGLTKRYGEIVAVDRMELEIESGEFFTLLGPSGSGKTTTLRMIAGFEIPDAGTVELAGRDVTPLPPYDREVNTVFQDYALFPHMSVSENIEYGLRVRKIPRVERERRRADALRMVRLEGFESRKPGELSGGQRQRIALARAIVNRPRVLLLDEPLGALDLKLREQMQVELKGIQGDVGITFIYVTHDQEEALTMSNRIAVMNAGRIEQVGTPQDIYNRPKTRFVSDFIGEINLFSGEWRAGVFVSDGKALPAPTGAQSGKATIAIRPERIRMVEHAEASLKGRVETSVFVSGHTIYRVALDDGPVLVVKDGGSATRPLGTRVGIDWDPNDVVVLSD